MTEVIEAIKSPCETKTVNPIVDGRKPRVTEMDKEIGERIRFMRTALGLTQVTVGTFLGITFQQVQKYEQGLNRISAVNLKRLSHIFDCEVTHFYPLSKTDYNAPNKLTVNEASSDQKNQWDYLLNNVSASKETANLLYAYYGVKNPKVRKKIAALINAVSTAENVDEQ